MDALYIYKHSRFADEEIRYSLRSVHSHAPFIQNIWIFGDKPHFLKEEPPRIHHVPHEYTARVTNTKTPIVNIFSLIFHASLIPELDFEFLWFCDDFILLNDLDEDTARLDRYVERLGNAKNRGRGLWMDSLWRTYDLLKRFDYTDYNFESHTPTYYTKKRILEAYCEFKDFVTDDRWYGMVAPTAILNHTHRQSPLKLTHRNSENAYVGFHHKQPDEQTVRERCEGKLFLNFDDDAYGPSIRKFLQERFPDPCPFEKPVSRHSSTHFSSATGIAGIGFSDKSTMTGGVFLPPTDA